VLRKQALAVRRTILRLPLPLATLHVFGDSHARAYNQIVKRRMLRTHLDVTYVEGATAMGITNPNSRTNALPIFRAIIRRLPSGRPLLFALGEVDCGFLVWTRGDPMAAMHLAVDRYLEFVGECRDRRVLVSEVVPPTVAGPTELRPLDVSLRDRIELTRAFNERLARDAPAAGVEYLAIGLTDEAGAVLPGLQGTDHHLGPTYIDVLARALRRAGFS